MIGSLALHAACALALIAVRAPSPVRDREPSHVALVEARPVELVELDLAVGGGGGTPGHGATRPEPAKATRIARVDRRDRRAARRPAIQAAPSERSLSDALAEVARASHEITDGGSAGGDGGDGGGRGGGRGRGIGRGIGDGLGDRASAGELLPAVPAAPAASKARPARLIYPTRERDVSEGDLYVARVTVDRDGYVVGARLLRSGGPKDGDASAMIFRFRYAPALDDDGRPIRSTVEQPFLVQ